MIAVRLLKPDEYLPELEERGVTFVEAMEIEGICHSVFEDQNGKRYIVPGERGDPTEVPMMGYEQLSYLYSVLPEDE